MIIFQECGETFFSLLTIRILYNFCNKARSRFDRYGRERYSDYNYNLNLAEAVFRWSLITNIQTHGIFDIDENVIIHVFVQKNCLFLYNNWVAH